MSSIFINSVIFLIFLSRSSFFSFKQGSRRINYKGLVKDCLSIMFEISGACNDIRHHSKLQENPAKEPSKCYDYAVAISFSEVQKHTCLAMQKLLLMVILINNAYLELLLVITVKGKLLDLLGHRAGFIKEKSRHARSYHQSWWFEVFAYVWWHVYAPTWIWILLCLCITLT